MAPLMHQRFAIARMPNAQPGTRDNLRGVLNRIESAKSSTWRSPWRRGDRSSAVFLTFPNYVSCTACTRLPLRFQPSSLGSIDMVASE